MGGRLITAGREEAHGRQQQTGRRRDPPAQGRVIDGRVASDIALDRRSAGFPALICADSSVRTAQHHDLRLLPSVSWYDRAPGR
jgi:hypothetical protein